MVETLILPVAVGIVLLFIEYKTHWFAQSLSSLQTADWLQVAEEVKEHLAQSIAEELDGPICLWEVRPQRNCAFLVFYCQGADGNDNKFSVVVDREGHVYQLQRDFESNLQ
jgi:hypothetical protein